MVILKSYLLLEKLKKKLKALAEPLTKEIFLSYYFLVT